MGNITSGATSSQFPSHLYASQYSDVKSTISNHLKATLKNDLIYSHPNGEVIPLVLSKDVSCQTDVSYNSNHSVKTREKHLHSITNIFKWVISLYIVLVFLLVSSPPLQSIIVYLNVIRWPLGSLTSLHRFGLDNLARNIHFSTEDGFILKGYHFLPSTDTLSLVNNYSVSINTANVISNNNYRDIDSFFDSKLANSDRIIIYFHGNAGTRAVHHRIEIAKKLSIYYSAHIISFDYRGFGDSEGFPSEYGTLLDGKAVIKWIDDIVESFNTNNNRPIIYFYGHSLGTGISTALTEYLNKKKEGTVQGLILDAPFTSIPDASMDHPTGLIFRIFSFTKQLMHNSLHVKYSTFDKIIKTNCHILLLHGTLDHDIPMRHSQLLFEQLKKHKMTFGNYSISRTVVAGAKHDDVYKFSDWIKSISLFMKDVEHRIVI